MKFSAQEEYGLRCLVAIAERNSPSGLTIPELSRIEGLSQPHVAKMMALLRKAGFVRSTRGQLGGYTLARDPERIVVGEVLEALGGRLYEPAFCERHAGTLESCAHVGSCSLRPLWERIQSAIDTVVYSVTLRDLMTDRPEERQTIQVRPSVER
ncbi:MAG: Rrf2 family transcriptional regulator [Anaerolineales bacterium]|jgi:Rrf2 family protein|nr:Rrf2 family transcriptional regulator [Anaerolineales bacterium]